VPERKGKKATPLEPVWSMIAVARATLIEQFAAIVSRA
jgi:hypothetical protein